MKQRGGFTLIELLVGLAILALLAGMISGIFSSSARFRKATEERTARVHAASVTLTRLADELAMAYYESQYAESSGFFLSTSSDEHSTLEFTGRTVRIPTIRVGGDTRLRYELEKDSDNYDAGYILKRTESNVLDADLDVEGVSYEMLHEVAKFKVECYDGGEWTTSWEMLASTAGDPPEMPLAVRVTLALKENAEDEEGRTVLRTMTPIYGKGRKPKQQGAAPGGGTP